MPNADVKRSYRSSHRSKQAADTRRAVLVAARAAFVSLGWRAATIAGIAKSAGVSAETIYAVFGNKRTLLEALMSAAVRGDDTQTPLLKQAGPRAIADARSQVEQIALFAHDIENVLSRIAPLMGVVRTAAETDEDLAELYINLHSGRRRNLAFVIDALVVKGPLRKGLTREAALETLWRLVSPELYLLMVGVEGVGSTGYEAWLAETLSQLLLGQDLRKTASDS